MSDDSHAIFISYASEDADAAESLCNALRAAGIDVFFDRHELRGGDVWDSKIRRQIQDCALFMPLVSRHTQARLEGYFRLEWKLAVDRSHLMAAERLFFLPVVVDDTRDQDAVVPDAFRAVQWTRLPGGAASPSFVARVQALLAPAVPATHTAKSKAAPVVPPSTRPGRRIAAALAVGGVAVALLSLGLGARQWLGRPGATPTQAAPAVAARDAAGSAFAPPPHSVAVLPFLNLSGDKDQEYFSDGLTEELLNALTEVSELRVAARTSSFAFKGQEVDLGTIARKLNVGAVLEGSVRRSGNTLRVTAQLDNAVTGFHLWSHTYDRGLGDTLKLQTEVATAVAGALKVSLLGDESTKIELGGTHNPAAFDVYLRGRKRFESIEGDDDYRRTIADFDEAIRLDPDFAQALAARSVVRSYYAGYAAQTSSDFVREGLAQAQADARRAIELAPDLAEAHLALGLNLGSILQLPEAGVEYERALALAPHAPAVLRQYSGFSKNAGHADRSIETAREALALDPLNHTSHRVLAEALFAARRYPEAIVAYRDAQALTPLPLTAASIGIVQYLAGDLDRARASCEGASGRWPSLGNWYSRWCLSMVYEKLQRHADAQAALDEMKKTLGDTAAFQFAVTYAQWGERSKALEWLDTAVNVRDPGLWFLKANPLLDPLRQEPRFQAIVRSLHFPD